MSRALGAMALASILGGIGCAPSTIGPFVKTITRTSDALAIVSCEIVLSGSELSEGRCYSQVVPLPRTPGATGLAAPEPAIYGPSAAPPAPPRPPGR
jgi:hypothetical protein